MLPASQTIIVLPVQTDVCASRAGAAFALCVLVKYRRTGFALRN
jgi:hypothetical protein